MLMPEETDAVAEPFRPSWQIYTAALQDRWGEMRGLLRDRKRLTRVQLLIVAPPVPGHDDQGKSVDLFRLL